MPKSQKNKAAFVLSITSIFYLFVSASSTLAEDDVWIPIGFNKDRVAHRWVKIKSYEPLNENSFSVAARALRDDGTQFTGRIEVNCKNKDYSLVASNWLFSQRSEWIPIPVGSAAELVASLFCKKTAARADWGYGLEDSLLWDQPSPKMDPGIAKGEWVLVTDNDEEEVYYNDAVVKSKSFVQAAVWQRTKKGDRSASSPKDNQKYFWINASCSDNKYSVFYQPDPSAEGGWLAPTPSRPGGFATAVRKKYCG